MTKILKQRKFAPAALGTGVVLAGIAGGACWVDLANNYKFGMSMSHELGIVMGLSALALTLLPASKPMLKGHPGALRIVRFGTWIALAMTVLAALSAHMDKQAADRMHRLAQNTTYTQQQTAITTAQRDYDQAKAEVAAISETSPSATLVKLADDRDADAKREAGNKFCGSICQGYRTEAIAYRERAGKAKAREDAVAQAEDAKSRLKRAEGGEKAGPAEVSPLATAYAAQFGKDASAAVRDVELLTAVLSILATVSLALLSEPAVALMRVGLGMLDHAATEQPEPAAAKASVVSAVAKVTEAAKRGRKPMTQDERMLQFIQERLRPGAGEINGGVLYGAFSSWWNASCPGLELPSNRKFADVAKAAGVAKRRKSTGSVYAAQLLQ